MNPTDTAKRAMLELTNRKLPPTPANYARIYGAITGDGGAMTAAEAIEPPVSGMAPLRARERVLYSGYSLPGERPATVVPWPTEAHGCR